MENRTTPSILFGLIGLLLAAAPAPAQSTKDRLIQIQREVALTQDALRQIDRTNGEKIAGLEALLKQNLEAVTRLNQAVAVIERAVNKQSDAILPPVNRTAAKTDALADQFAGLRDAVEESNSMITKLQREVADIKTHLTTLPPPSAGGEGGALEDSGDSLFDGAFTDYNRGDYDISKAQFTDFLRYYGESSKAVEAQYFLGAIAYNQGEFEAAIQEFDLVLERFPAGYVSAEAQYKKAMALEKLGRGDEARVELQALLDRFPNSSVADNARGMLDRLRADAGAADKPSPLRR